MVAAINTLRSMARPEASQMRFVVSALSLKSTMLFIHDHNPGLLFLKQYSPILAEAAKIYDQEIVSGYIGSLGKKYYTMALHETPYFAADHFKNDPLTWFHTHINPAVETGVATGVTSQDTKFPYSAVS